MLHNHIISNSSCISQSTPYPEHATANDLAVGQESGKKLVQRLAWALALLIAMVMIATGCDTTPPEFPLPNMETFATNHTETVVLREGDVLKITFPGAPNLNATPKIQRDGNINLQLVNEIKAAGKTLGQLHEDLLKAYKDQIESKVIEVELVSSEFPVFVSGAVLRPMKVMSDHPMTVLEAIMECGGFDYTKANLKTVKVLRQQGKRLKSYTVNLRDVMKGHPQDDQFYVQPQDIIYVPERFTWF